MAKETSLPPPRVTEKFREETEKCAEYTDENLSEYVREAVRVRNTKVKRAQSKSCFK